MDQDESAQLDKLSIFMLRFSQWISIIFGLVVSWFFYIQELASYKYAAIYLGWVLFASLLLMPLIIKIANVIRVWVQPDVLFTRGFKDSVKQKLFWSWGPQFFGLGGMLLFGIIMPVNIHYMINSGGFEHSEYHTTSQENIQFDNQKSSSVPADDGNKAHDADLVESAQAKEGVSTEASSPAESVKSE